MQERKGRVGPEIIARLPVRFFLFHWQCFFSGLTEAQRAPEARFIIEFISNLFLKKTGDLGPVTNLKPFMNKFVVKRHFQMETISVAREFINSNDYLVSVDLSHAFFSIPVHESYPIFLRFIWKEQFTSFFAFDLGIV